MINVSHQGKYVDGENIRLVTMKDTRWILDFFIFVCVGVFAADFEHACRQERHQSRK